ncbi:MAG: response regulator transcription factor [Flavisolibacter sp.]|jgi:DNA-binding NarL/FixJ family response regulator|nr:response regulator transcription factor [Flavisolibacter sp.]
MSAVYPIRIVLADDHELLREGFKVLLKKQSEIQVIGEASNGLELCALIEKDPPDVVITDIKMPKMDGIEATKLISKNFPHIGVIAFSMFNEESLVVDMLEAGAKGYLLKNAHKDEILDAIKMVNEDRTYYCSATSAKLASMIAKSSFDPYSRAKPVVFTEKEIAVICMVCEEKTNKEIADKMNLSIRTIEGYRDRIQEKIKAKNGAGIVVYAIRHRIYKIDE